MEIYKGELKQDFLGDSMVNIFNYIKSVFFINFCF